MTENRPAGLSCLGLDKSFGQRRVLESLDLEVQGGTVTAILGASGAGKTTLLRVLMGLDRLDAGRITVGAKIVADQSVHVPTERRRVGYVSQEGALFPQLTVGDNVAFGLPRGERKSSNRVHEVLDLVGLSQDFLTRNPAELSGGEQRRVALARALAPRPNLILLDEPFTGLDAALRVDTREAVLQALSEEDATALLVTHDQAEALSTGDHVGVLRDGRLVQLAEPERLYRRPVDLAVALFVGEAVVIPGDADGDSVTCMLGVLPIENRVRPGRVDVMIRPEQLHVALPAASGASGDGPSPKAVVTRRRFSGTDVTLSMMLTDPKSGTATELTARTRSLGAPTVGEKVGVHVHGAVQVYAAGSGETL
jgi:iron(III) transport system ATP-binding protein